MAYEDEMRMLPADSLAEEDPALIAAAQTAAAQQAPINSAAPVDDPRLQQALEAQAKQRLMSDLLRGFQQGLQGAAPNSGFKADYTMADTIAKRADEPVQQYQAKLAQEAAGRKEGRESQEFANRQKESSMRQEDFQIKLAKSKLDFQDMEANRDPASPQSKIAQDRVIEVQKKMKQPVNEEQIRGMAGEQLYKYFDYLKQDLTEFYKNENARLEREKDLTIADKNLQAQKERNTKLDAMEDRRVKKEERQETDSERRYRQQQINTARGMIKDDPRFKKSMEQSMAFDDLDQLIAEAEKGNQQAVGALGTKLARAMGEVGVMTDTDVVRYVAGQSWGRKLNDWFTKGATGELSPETMKGIKSNLKVLKNKLGGDVKRVVDNSAARMKAAYPEMQDADIRGILGFTNQPAESKGPYGDTTERDGKKYKWNPAVGKYQIIE